MPIFANCYKTINAAIRRAFIVIAILSTPMDGSAATITLTPQTPLCASQALLNRFFVMDIQTSLENLKTAEKEKAELLKKGCSLPDRNITVSASILESNKKETDALVRAVYPDGSVKEFWTYHPKIFEAVAADTKTKQSDLKAGCHIKTPDAIMCSDASSAALAYKEYGFNSELINQTYTLKILHESGCYKISSNGYPYKKKWNPTKIKEAKSFKVAMPDGWMEMKAVQIYFDHNPLYDDKVAGKDLFTYVAGDYISGTCEKFVVSSVAKSSP